MTEPDRHELADIADRIVHLATLWADDEVDYDVEYEMRQILTAARQRVYAPDPIPRWGWTGTNSAAQMLDVIADLLTKSRDAHQPEVGAAWHTLAWWAAIDVAEGRNPGEHPDRMFSGAYRQPS